MEGDQSDYDEGGDMSSDDDYSPGSLVIDTEGGETSNPPTPQSPVTGISHDQFTPVSESVYPTSSSLVTLPHTITSGTPTQNQVELNSFPFKPSETHSFPTFSLQQGHTLHSSTHSQAHSFTNSAPSQSYMSSSTTPSHPVNESRDVTVTPLVTMGQRVSVFKQGSSPVDTLCVYYYHWRDVQLDILVTAHHPTYIPIKNVYQRAIPCLKQNVLSARISKHGIRSAVLPEPYVSTLKKLGMGLTGSSHYITIPDFFKICRYFKYNPPESLSNFRFISAEVAPSDVLEIFNDPGSERGRKLLETLRKSEGVTDGMSVGGDTSVSGKSTPIAQSLGEREEIVDEGVLEVDARSLTLPDGRSIVFLIRGGIPYIPNPELAKILPNVTRTAMEVIRNTYGIIVEQSSKQEINLMKLLGIVSPKAGRTLLYRVTDVAKMYPHWKMIIPDFIDELCAGKIPEDKIDPSVYSRVASSPHGRSPLTASQPSRPKRKNGRGKSKHPESPSSLWTGKIEEYSGSGVEPVWMSSGGMPLHTPTSLTTHRSTSSSHLTPDWFQQPVKLLNSIQLALSNPSEYPAHHMTSSSGHMTTPSSLTMDTSSHVTTPSSHVTTGFVSPTQLKPPRRRSSGSSAPPLDDAGLEYANLSWGEHTLTLLCPHGNQPYIPIPDLIKKVLKDRSHMSPQRRTDLGVATLPTTSLQIHTLRAHGSLVNFSGNVKLVSLSDAVRVAVNANLIIPGSIIHALRSYKNCIPQPIEHLLTPQSTPPPQASRAPHESQPHPPLQTFTLPAHPEIIDLGRSFQLSDGLLCQIKWGDLKLVVYVMTHGAFYMGLYQIYEELFKQYVTRVNFKMRMRKLHVRSIRAAPIVRVKLIELGALPPHCPVCGLILVSQVEKLAKSYGVVPPNVIYEVFLSQEVQVAPPISQAKASRPKKVPIHRKDPSKSSSSAEAPPSQSTHNVFMYQFNDSPNQAHPTVSLVGRSPTMNTVNQGNLIGQSDADRLVSPVYGVVPYLTSSREILGESPNSKHLTMTSTPPVSIDQLIPASRDESFVISIPRSLTRFRIAQSGHNPLVTNALTAAKPTSVPLGGSRRKVLQNLAKKIAQKSRKFTATPQLPSSRVKPAVSPFGPEGIQRVCTSCRRGNPPEKKRCVFCGSVLGRSCPTCGSVNQSSATSCYHCHTNLTYTWTLPIGAASLPNSGSLATSTTYLSSIEASDPSKVSMASVSPTSSSPTSPKFSAPPIRSAVLKNLFPQRSESSDSAAAPMSSGQVMTSKTMFLGNISSSRKCPECGQLNSKMAKKCVQCRSHLQGRACTRCGRPNLSIVSECYKCGAPLPSSTPSTKWVYRGGRSGREYKPPQSHEEKILQSSAPVSCIRCHNIRLSSYFKCGRCGDVFKTLPLVDKTPEAVKQEGEELGESSNQKRRRISPDSLSLGGLSTPTNLTELTQLQEFGLNILTLDLADHLAPLLIQREEESREKLPQAEEELEAAESEYHAFLQKKQFLEVSIESDQAELDGLLSEMERLNSSLKNTLTTEKEAQKSVETLPDQISELKKKLGKINASQKLFQNVSREV